MFNWLYERFCWRESKASRQLGELLHEYNEICEPEPNWQSRAIAAELLVEQLQRERRELFTVKEVNEHTEVALSVLKGDIQKLTDTNRQARNLLGLGLGVSSSSVDINTAWHEIEKKSSQSVVVNVDSL